MSLNHVIYLYTTCTLFLLHVKYLYTTHTLFPPTSPHFLPVGSFSHLLRFMPLQLCKWIFKEYQPWPINQLRANREAAQLRGVNRSTHAACRRVHRGSLGGPGQACGLHKGGDEVADVLRGGADSLLPITPRCTLTRLCPAGPSPLLWSCRCETSTPTTQSAMLSSPVIISTSCTRSSRRLSCQGALSHRPDSIHRRQLRHWPHRSYGRTSRGV